MASISSSNSLCSSPLLLNTHEIRPHHQPNRASSSTIVSASRNEADRDRNYYYGGRIVDDNLIVLRKRIHGMKMAERNYEAPAHWMEWEKNCYVGYEEFICEAMGLLQTQLMNTRPCLALGLMVMVGLSVPASAAFLWFRLAETVTKGVLFAGAGVHLN